MALTVENAIQAIIDKAGTLAPTALAEDLVYLAKSLEAVSDSTLAADAAAQTVIDRANTLSPSASPEELIYLAKAVEALAIAATIGDVTVEGTTQVNRVIAEGGTQQSRVVDEGDAQVARVTTAAPVQSVNGQTGAVVLDIVTPIGAQTLTNKTFTGYTETVHALAGTNINPANGTIQHVTLAANTTFTESLADGQSVTLMINPVTFSVTWPAATWIGAKASTAPTLVASVYNCIVLFQFGGVLYAKYEGRV